VEPTAWTLPSTVPTIRRASSSSRWGWVEGVVEEGEGEGVLSSLRRRRAEEEEVLLLSLSTSVVAVSWARVGVTRRR